jgi:hypothetical protein
MLRRLARTEIEWLDERNANLARDETPKNVRKEGGERGYMVLKIVLESPEIKRDYMPNAR